MTLAEEFATEAEFIRPKELEPGDSRRVDPSAILRPYEGSLVSGQVIADMYVSDSEQLSLVDTRWREAELGAPFFIAGSSAQDPNQDAYVPVIYGEVTEVGRMHSSDVFHLDDKFSRHQLRVHYGVSGLVVQTDTRASKSVWLTTSQREPEGQQLPQARAPRQAEGEVSSRQDRAERLQRVEEKLRQPRGRHARLPGIDFESELGLLPLGQQRTYNVQVRMQGDEDYREPVQNAPYGYYQNHPIIGRHSEGVDNGVYMGGSAREAIVVDGSSPELQAAYNYISGRIKENAGRLSEREILQMVVNYTAVLMKDAQGAELFAAEFGRDEPVGLSQFIRQGIGVCRHRGLLAAYLAEQLSNANYLDGVAGMERNEHRDGYGTHGWAVFRSKTSKEVLVLDAMQYNFVGTKAEAQRRGLWEYDLATDDMAYGPFASSGRHRRS